MEALAVCIGAVTLDLIAVVDSPLEDDERVIARDAVLGSGGPAATAAVALARMGVPAAFIGTVGDDGAGALVREWLVREGVDTAGLKTVGGTTAMSPIWVDRSTGHRSIAAYYGTVGLPVLSSDDLERCRQAAWIHVDHVGFSATARLRAEGIHARLSVDAGNPIPDLTLRDIDLYGPTEPRLLERYPGRDLPAAIEAALDEGAESVVVTLGGGGSVAAMRPRKPGAPPGMLAVEAFDVPVASTLGAGDVFHGGLIAALVHGLDLGSALVVANAAAALSCRALDGRGAIPVWEEVLAFLSDRGRDLTRTSSRQMEAT
jgi:sulfofructose kinase